MRLAYRTALAALLFACSSATPPLDVRPPDAPDAGPVLDTALMTFAIDSVQLGDSTITSSAWEQFGFDIDGKLTSKTSTDVCTPSAGAPPFYQTDGIGGRDNSFGEWLVPMIE